MFCIVCTETVVDVLSVDAHSLGLPLLLVCFLSHFFSGLIDLCLISVLRLLLLLLLLLCRWDVLMELYVCMALQQVFDVF